MGIAQSLEMNADLLLNGGAKVESIFELGFVALAVKNDLNSGPHEMWELIENDVEDIYAVAL